MDWKQMGSGYTTYVAGAGIIGLTVAHIVGAIDDTTFKAGFELLTGGAVIGLRRALEQNATQLQDIHANTVPAAAAPSPRP